MGLHKFEHVTREIDGINYRVIESGISRQRADFLQQLLRFNRVETRLEQDPPQEGKQITYTLLTPDVTFNPVVKVYNRELRTPDGRRVTPDYWNQLTEDTNPNYWDLSKKDFIKR
jgi:hypothetical protein